MTSQKTMTLAIVLFAIPVFSALTILTQDSALAYNRLGFDSEQQCLKVAELEQKEGLLNSTAYQELVDICTHANTANATNNTSNITTT